MDGCKENKLGNLLRIFPIYFCSHAIFKILNRKLSQREHFELRTLKKKLGIPSSGSPHGGLLAEDRVTSLSWKGLHSVGFYYDLPQVGKQV